MYTSIIRTAGRWTNNHVSTAMETLCDGLRSYRIESNSTYDIIKTEDINEILDTLIKQAENGNQNGVYIDKVEKKTNDSSKIIYLKPNNSVDSRSPTDSELSEEIIVELKESTSEETIKRQDGDNISSPYVQNQRGKIFNDMNDKVINTYFREPREESIIEKHDKIGKIPSANNDDGSSLAMILKNLFENRDLSKSLEDNGTNDFKKDKIIIREDIPNEDNVSVRMGMKDNEYPLQEIPRNGYELDYRTPFRQLPLTDQLQNSIPQHFLAQILQNEANMNMNYLPNFLPTYKSPVPSITRTVIHQSGIAYQPHGSYLGHRMSGKYK
ncbi:unnamed protein product [Diatraea saccharalis]|uniref:Uncharacterized protein n=1 Tax=Diatraea saccharalis TaxID=40085 RepID=A0A9N9WCF0_9NEOP|nr:unnamed protein product [Diatraea saccharalis]